MGRRSVREDKNIYQISREAQDLTRAEASEVLGFISADRIDKIERGLVVPDPTEIMAMAKGYRVPTLCNYYCSHVCAIGKEYVPEIQMKDLSQIVLELLAGINSLSRDKDRLIEIAADSNIDETELEDFNKIRDALEKMSITIDSLKLWVDSKMNDN